MTDATISSFDAKIQLLTNQQNALQQRITAYKTERIPWLNQLAQYAASGGQAAAFLTIYNKLQDWNQRWLSQPAKYISSGPTVANPTDAAEYNRLSNVDLTQTVPDLEKQFSDIGATLATEIANRTAYLNSLPSIVTQNITSQNEVNELNAVTTVNQTAAELAKIELEAKDKTFAQSQAKIITYVGVGVALLVVVLIVYFSFFNKKRPTAA